MYEIGINFMKQNCSSQEEIKMFFRPFFDHTHSFRFNRIKTFSKMKNSILHQIYGGYEKMLKYKIVCFEKIDKFAVDYFFIGVIYFL